MELRFMNNSSNTANSSPNHSKSNSNSTSNNSCHNSQEKLNCYSSNDAPHTPPQRSTSSCETLEAVDGISCALTPNGLDPNSPLCKPLPPLPSKNSAKLANHTTSTMTKSNSSSSNSNHLKTSNNNLNNSQAHLASQGIHHAQPYYQTPPTPTMMNKRDYQQPPPVPPHQNNNHTPMMNHHLPPTGHHVAPLTPSLEQQRRTIDHGGVRNMSYNQNNCNTQQLPPSHDPALNMDGMGTRIPSLRRTRRTSGGSTNNGLNSLSNNPNGGLGIPIAVSGSPRVQRSPMPARAAMMKQRSRLGSHNDNISSGSLNSIEV